MGKGGGRKQKKDTKNPKFQTRDTGGFTEEDMDDEIDAFHKQRDIIPLDLDDDTASSDEDNIHPVYDIQGLDEDEDDDEDDDEEKDKFLAKIAKQQKIMRRKTGGVEDETHDDSEEEEDKDQHGWTRRNPYGADNVHYEIQSSDEDLPAEEEAEVLRLQKEKAKLLHLEDFVQEDSASDEEKTIEDLLSKTRGRSKGQKDKVDKEDTSISYVVKKDLNASSKEEQMEAVYSAAPELVGLLSELNDALDQLESKVNPLINKVRKRNDSNKEGIHYLETKQHLLLAYCQAISFYFLLKSEGHSVRDHPVIARLVEIKELLDKMKRLDDKLPSELEEILNQDHGAESGAELIRETASLTSEPIRRDNEQLSIPTRIREDPVLSQKSAELLNNFSKENGRKRENRKEQVGLQNMEMLKMRASLEEKLKQNGIFSSVANKLDRPQKFPSQAVNNKLETIHDFGDEVIDREGGNDLINGNRSSMHSSKLSKMVATKLNKVKVVSGDDDLPKRDDVGERRRKHELRVLANAGVGSNDEDRDEPESPNAKSVGADIEDGETEESENKYYKQVKRQRFAKLSAKAEIYSRTPATLSLAEPDIVDGKRLITRQIEKNRGLTRPRNKLKKNPRRNYKLKHKKKVTNRHGQVRDVKKPLGPYGGETTGINTGTSGSIRFK